MDRNKNQKKPLNEACGAYCLDHLDGRGGSKLIYKPGMRKGSIIIREVGPSITKESKINKIPQHVSKTAWDYIKCHAIS